MSALRDKMLAHEVERAEREARRRLEDAEEHIAKLRARLESGDTTHDTGEPVRAMVEAWGAVQLCAGLRRAIALVQADDE